MDIIALFSLEKHQEIRMRWSSTSLIKPSFLPSILSSISIILMGETQLGHIGHIALPEILCIYVVVDIYRFLHCISSDPLHVVSAHPGP
jgi:hypothetical protein